jgi:ABC-type multidrug transport system permease subunit
MFWTFLFPTLLALGLGMAFRNQPNDHRRIAVVSGPVSATVIEQLRAAPFSVGRADLLPSNEALDRFRLGQYEMVISPDADGSLLYEVDPTRTESVLAATDVNNLLQSVAGRKDPLLTRVHTSTKPGARYIDYLIPGLIGMSLMGSGMWGVGFVLVDMRQRKLLKRLFATPMRRVDLLLALATSRFIIMLIEVGLLLGFGAVVFHLRVTGSWVAILLVSSLGAFGFAGLGLLSACRTQKAETASSIINVVMMPMWIFSGVFFSYERFPAIVQPLIKALPLTALDDALRATILQGDPLSMQVNRLLVLAVWGGVSFLLALRLFRWT